MQEETNDQGAHCFSDTVAADEESSKVLLCRMGGCIHFDI